MIHRALIGYYIDREFGGGKLAKEQSDSLSKTADDMYKEAGRLRKEAAALLKPRRS
jgi:hypothetical protein